MICKKVDEMSIKQKHIPVLMQELISYIEISKESKNIIVDCTLGMAGHGSEIIKAMNPGDIFIGFDADIRNLELAKKRLEDQGNSDKVEVILINSNFVNLKSELEKIGIEKVTGIYYDLGVSSLHIDEAERGFSFRLDGPLDMRFDTNSGLSAERIINSYSESDLRKIFLNFGEEPKCTKIARVIVEKRKKKKFKTTLELREAIEEVSKDPKSKSRIFQALRIEANKELENLEISLDNAIKLLEKDGIIFAISFHSLEDRIVKNILRRETKDCICSDLICSCNHKKSLKVLTKKPIRPSEKEVKENPRSRSAKARVAQKINN